MADVKVGIVGCGNISDIYLKNCTEVFDILKVVAVCDLIEERAREKAEKYGIPKACSVDELLNDPEINIVVETIGGYEPAFTFISKALKNRKHVVTANKALIATKGMELYKIAQENGVDFLFEASVGGGIPIIKGLREGLVANRFESIYGILNGTTNYILTKMHRDGLEFDEALKGAQEKGFAEANPTLDISGGDAAHKLTILSSIASNSFIPFDKIYMEGITGITKMDITFAQSFGMTIKLLAIYRAYKDGLDLRVHPTLINNSHLLAAVSNELNAIFVKGDFVGDTMFYGPGAGERPTASAIISDIVDLSRDLLLQEGEKYCNRAISLTQNVQLIPIEDVTSRFYLRFMTKDIPGVLSMISGVLAENGISISSMVQLESHEKDNYVPIVLLTHEALEKSMERALQKIVKFDFVKEDYLRLRIFEES